MSSYVISFYYPPEDGAVISRVHMPTIPAPGTMIWDRGNPSRAWRVSDQVQIHAPASKYDGLNPRIDDIQVDILVTQGEGIFNF